MVELCFDDLLDDVELLSKGLVSLYSTSNRHQEFLVRSFKKTFFTGKDFNVEKISMSGMNVLNTIYVPFDLDSYNVQKYIEKELQMYLVQIFHQNEIYSNELSEAREKLAQLFRVLNTKFNSEFDVDLDFHEPKFSFEDILKYLKPSIDYSESVFSDNVRVLKEQYIELHLKHKKVQCVIVEYPETRLHTKEFLHFIEYLKGLPYLIVLLTNHPICMLHSEQITIWNDVGRKISFEQILQEVGMFSNNRELNKYAILAILTGFLENVPGVEYELIRSILLEKI